MADIKQEIEQGNYRVDPKAVADAILRRLRELAMRRADGSRLSPGPYNGNDIARPGTAG